jgi:hypothetical protein
MIVRPLFQARQTKVTLESIGAMAADGAPYNIGNVTSDIAVNRANGIFQRVALTGATESRTLNAPTNGTSGQKLELDIHSTTGYTRTLELDAGIKVPSEWSGSFPVTLTQGKTYTLLLRYDGALTAWKLMSLTGGY